LALPNLRQELADKAHRCVLVDITGRPDRPMKVAVAETRTLVTVGTDPAAAAAISAAAAEVLVVTSAQVAAVQVMSTLS